MVLEDSDVEMIVAEIEVSVSRLEMFALSSFHWILLDRSVCCWSTENRFHIFFVWWLIGNTWKWIVFKVVWLFL